MNNSVNDSDGSKEPNHWTPSQITSAEQGDEGINLGEVLVILRGGKWIIASVTAAVLALALLYAFLAHPVYEANGLIQIQQQGQPTGAASDILSALLPIAAPADTEIAIMTSRSVLQPTVDRQHLNINVSSGAWPVLGSLLGGASTSEITITQLEVPDDWMDQNLNLTSEGNGVYLLLSPSGHEVLKGHAGTLASAKNGAVKIMVSRLGAAKGRTYEVTRIYDQEAIAKLQKQLNVAEQGRDTGIVQLTLDGPNPVRVKDILNTLMSQYIKQNIAAMAAQAKNSLTFVNKQLPQLKHELDSAQTKLTAYREKNGAVELDKQAEAMLQELTTLESQLTQLNLAQAAMRQRYTDRYPGLQSLQNQEKDLQGKINAIETQINRLPEQEQGYLNLMQTVQVYQQLYTALLAKAQDLQIAQAATTGSARIVDRADTPVIPISPRKLLAGVIGLVFGLFLGVLVVFLRRSLSRTVRDAAELERDFGLPVYAVVPHSGRQAYLMKKAKRDVDGRIAMLAADDPQDPTVESIRSLRTSINFALQGAARKVITLGGCSPGVGKSFLSVNLAHVMGGGNTRVLVIDGDMRLGHLEKYIGGRKEPGLSEVLSGQATLEESVYTTGFSDNVYFLPSGAYPPDPYGLVAGPNLEPLIDLCAEQYDVVVIDVPPVLAVAEGLIFSRLATANFLVIKAGVQVAKEVRIAIDRMRQNGVKLAGFVFNDLTRQVASYTYGRYANTYYYYRRGFLKRKKKR